MKHFFKASLYLVTLFALTACGGMPPKPDAIQAANYGKKPTKDEMTSAVGSYMSKRLIDPYSAVYECSNPEKAWVIGGPGSEGNVQLGRTYYGYLSTCTINSKNRLGGYVGAQEYMMMLYDCNGSACIAYFDGYRDMGLVPE